MLDLSPTEKISWKDDLMTAAALGAGAEAEVRTARLSLRLLFLMIGLFGGAWGVLVPFAKAQLGLNDGDLGLIMLSGGIGGVFAMPLGSWLLRRIGSRALLGYGAAAMTLLLPGILLAPSGFVLGVVLFCLGLSVGMQDIALNAQAVLIEERSGRPEMSFFHGCFSIGGLFVPLVLGVMLKAGMTPFSCLLVVAVLVAVLIATQIRSLYPRAADRQGAGGSKFALPHGRTWLIGLFCFIFYMAEGTIFDWSSLFLREYRSFDPAWSGLGLAAFSVTMTAMRFVGRPLVERFGSVRMVAGGSALAAAGMLLAVTLPWAWAGILGFAIFGLGASNVVPLAFSSAGRLPGVSPAAAIAAMATLGNCGVLMGPASIGFLSNAFGLPMALALVAVLVVLVATQARQIPEES